MIGLEERFSRAARAWSCKMLCWKYPKLYWVAVKELKLSYYIRETLLFTIELLYIPIIVT